MMAAQDDVVVTVAPAQFVRIPLAAQITGYTVKAIEHKIDSGVWAEGREWIRAPDGSRLISLRGYERWAQSNKK